MVKKKRKNRYLTMKNYWFHLFKNYRIIQVFHFFLHEYEKLYFKNSVSQLYFQTLLQSFIMPIYYPVTSDSSFTFPVQVVFIFNFLILSRCVSILLVFSKNLQTLTIEINRNNKQTYTIERLILAQKDTYNSQLTKHERKADAIRVFSSRC